MNKIIPIGIVVFLILAAAVILIPHGKTTTVIASTTSVPIAQTTIIPTSTVPVTTSIPGTNAINCVSPNAIVPIYNGNFSTGTYAGWIVNGIGFGKIPSNITFDDQHNEYYGQPWTGYNGTYFATSYSGGTSVSQGNLTSAPFLVTEPYINFQVISPQNGALYVQVLQNGKPRITLHYNTYIVPIVNTTNTTNKFDSTSNFFNATMVVVPLLCTQVQIKLVAGTVGTLSNQFNYIAATNFYQSKKPISTPAIIVNQTLNFT